MLKRKVMGLVLTIMLLATLASCCPFTLPSAQPTQAPLPTYTARPTYTAVPPSALPQATKLLPSAPASDLEARVEEVFRTAGPSVVNVTSRAVVLDFFMQSVPQEGTGSGFVYDDQGHIVTNYHVVENAETVTVAFASGDTYPAEIVGQDSSNDLAVLKVTVPDLPRPLPLGDSSQLSVGQFVVAIGNPFRLDRTLTLGIISALQRVIQSPDGRFIGEAIQTDAAINPGNSGGPMLNLDGEVIGVNSQIISPSGANAGIGFAISSNTVRRVVPELIARGRYAHPWLGVRILTLAPEVLDALQQAGVDIPVPSGVLVTEVVSGGPAATAGVRAGTRTVQVSGMTVAIGGDIITAIEGKPVTSGQDLTTYLETQTGVGQTVELTVVRDSGEIKIQVKLGELPQS